MVHRTRVLPPFSIADVVELRDRLSYYRSRGYDRPGATSGQRSALSLVLAALLRAYVNA